MYYVLISAVDALLAVGIVAVAGEGDLGEVLVDVAHLLVGVGDGGSSEVLREVLPRCAARNSDNPRLLRHQPREGDISFLSRASP